jgi:hypothetical protein
MTRKAVALERERDHALNQLSQIQIENAQLREQILTEQQTRKVTCSRCGLWVAIRGHVCVVPIEFVELARPIGSTDEPHTYDGVRLDKAIKPRSGQ